ncbi:hypothetical protein HZH68_005525 [Vespula germanica]|uniref:Uncharacterized protein n=1 Tax=Vespula germanica TaxID=30212 RepID=A0A834KLC6_VESGE|nr:hypothetical protein HZH68_005525 [Vespula germanica]
MKGGKRKIEDEDEEEEEEEEGDEEKEEEWCKDKGKKQSIECFHFEARVAIKKKEGSKEFKVLPVDGDRDRSEAMEKTGWSVSDSWVGSRPRCGVISSIGWAEDRNASGAAWCIKRRDHIGEDEGL